MGHTSRRLITVQLLSTGRRCPDATDALPSSGGATRVSAALDPPLALPSFRESLTNSIRFFRYFQALAERITARSIPVNQVFSVSLARATAGREFLRGSDREYLAYSNQL